MLSTEINSAAPMKRPKLSTDATTKAAGLMIVTKQGRALFLRRRNKGRFEGEWSWPGGKIEKGETAEESAIRETREEIKWEPESEVKEIDNSVGDRGVDFTTFRTEVDGEFIPKLNEEHVGYAWASLDDPPEPLHPGCRRVIDMAMDAEFKESEHPRDADGKFGSGGGSGEKSEISIAVKDSELAEKAAPKPTQRQQEAIDNYTGVSSDYQNSNYEEINTILRRRGKLNPDSDGAHLQEYLMSAKTPKDFVVYRQVENTEFLKGMGEDRVFTDMGFVSTSFQEGNWHGDVGLEINVPKGSHGAFVNPETNPEESEFLLAAGGKFRVVDARPRLGMGPLIKIDFIGHDESSRVVGDKAKFEEGKHPRGQPENAGQFGPGGGGGGKAQPEGKAAPERPVEQQEGNSFKPGIVAQGLENATAKKKQWAEISPIKTAEDLWSEGAIKNQEALAKVSAPIAQKLGLMFKDPGIKGASDKGKARIQEKIDEGKPPNRINDGVRAGFRINTPGQADKIVEGLSKHFEIADEGWEVTDAGYFDRKVMVRFEDGQVGEVQIWHPELLDVKENKGHKLYEDWRTLRKQMATGEIPPDDPRSDQLVKQMREVYSQVHKGMSPDWLSLLGRGGSVPMEGGGGKPGNMDSKRALDSKAACIDTSMLGASRHSPLRKTNAFSGPGKYKAGSPSHEQYLIDSSVILDSFQILKRFENRVSPTYTPMSGTYEPPASITFFSGPCRRGAQGVVFDEKISKEEARYTDGPVDTEPCKRCSMYRDLFCTAVRGEISSNGHCKLWESKGVQPAMDHVNKLTKLFGFDLAKLIAKDLRMAIAMDAEFKESDHPRGQPGNAGQFGSGGGSKQSFGGNSGAGTYEFKGKKQLNIPPKKDVTGTLSDNATGWLDGYINGIELEAGQRNPVPSDEVVKELDKYRPKSTLLLYRAHTDDPSRQIESWSKYSGVAENIVGARAESDPGIKMIWKRVTPDEVIIDTTKLPRKFRDSIDITSQDLSEVIVASGDFLNHVKSLRNKAKDAAANEATENELRTTIKYPPPKSNSPRVIDQSFARGGLKQGESLRYAPKAQAYENRGGHDANKFEESKHPRGQPENAGQFGSGGGSKPTPAKPAAKASGNPKANVTLSPRVQSTPQMKATAEHVLSAVNNAVPEMGELKAAASKFNPDHIIISGSTERNSIGNPVSIPGHESATGFSIKVNPKTKHVHFEELNSHVKGAGARTVDAIMKALPGYKFSVLDWSQVGQEVRSGPSFWDKMKERHKGRFDEGMFVAKDQAFVLAYDKSILVNLGNGLYVKAPRECLAFDARTARFYDKDARLHLAVSNISKAVVNPYLGKEIPEFEQLGLEPNRIYRLYRDPQELAKAAPTFNGIPVLSEHVAVDAMNHRPDLVIGATGTDANFANPYLQNSLVFWDGNAIQDIESEDKKELSSAYRYRADMTPGSVQGENFDGVMRDLIANHVALVKEGRAGSDVVVGDSKENVKMPEKVKPRQMSRQAAIAVSVLSAHLRPKLAKDAKLPLFSLLDGVTTKNFQEKKPGILSGLKSQLKLNTAEIKKFKGKPKIAMDATIGEVAELLDMIENHGVEGDNDDMIDVPKPVEQMAQPVPEPGMEGKEKSPMLPEGSPAEEAGESPEQESAEMAEGAEGEGGDPTAEVQGLLAGKVDDATLAKVMEIIKGAGAHAHDEPERPEPAEKESAEDAEGGEEKLKELGAADELEEDANSDKGTGTGKGTAGGGAGSAEDSLEEDANSDKGTGTGKGTAGGGPGSAEDEEMDEKEKAAKDGGPGSGPKVGSEYPASRKGFPGAKELAGRKNEGEGSNRHSETGVGARELAERKNRRHEAQDEPPPFKGMPKPGGTMVTQDSMTAAIKAATDSERKNQRAIREAERVVRPLVGEMSIAFDSADEVYKNALTMLGVKDAGKIHPSAYPQLLDMCRQTRQHSSSASPIAADMAMDEGDDNSYQEMFPEADHIGVV